MDIEKIKVGDVIHDIRDAGALREIAGKGLSTNDYTNEDKSKLEGIEADAQKNKIESIKVNGSDVTPDPNKAVNVSVPTKMSDLNLDGGDMASGASLRFKNASSSMVIQPFGIVKESDNQSHVISFPDKQGTVALTSDIPDVSGKQDTIQDLETIRSGAAKGETSVQPLDIEDMVKAEPIGSIIPPVNPSEFATTEEVSQLEHKVTDNTGDIQSLQNQMDNYRPIVIEGNVENAPDNEDITTDENDLLKFANRAAHTNYLGYVILRKGKTFASQVTVPNTIYEIRYDFVLGQDEEITIPNGCVLRFDGGSISNGIIIGSDTAIESSINTIFKGSIVISGTWNCCAVYSAWFELTSADSAIDNRTNLQNILNLAKSNQTTDVYFSEGVYYLSVLSGADDYGMLVNSNTIMHCDGVEFRAIPNNSERYAIVKIQGVSNITIIGGTFVGDVDTHTGGTGGMGHGIYMADAKNIIVRDVVVKKCWGDGFYITNPYSFVLDEETGGQCENVKIKNCRSLTNRRQGCTIEAAIGVIIEDCEFAYTGTINGTAPMLGLDVEPYAEHQVVKDITIKNCNIHGNSNASASIAIGHGTAPEYLEDNVSIDNCVFDKVVNCKPLNGLSIKNTKMKSLFVNSQSVGARVSEKLVFNIFGCDLNGNIDFVSIESEGTIMDTTLGVDNRTFVIIERSSSVADIKFYNCHIITGGSTQTPYIETTIDLSKVGLHFYNCEISGAILNTAQIGFRIAGDFVGNVFDVSTSGNDTAYITLSAPGKKVVIKGNTFLNVGTQKRLIHFVQTNDLSAINPLYEIEGNRFIGGATSEKKIFFNYGGTPLKHIKSVGNFFPATAGYEAQSQVDISFTQDIFEVGNSLLLRNGSAFSNLDGTNINKVGTTANRPSATSVGAGFSYFDIDLGKMIVSNGTAWVNMDGTAL